MAEMNDNSVVVKDVLERFLQANVILSEERAASVEQNCRKLLDIAVSANGSPDFDNFSTKLMLELRPPDTSKYILRATKMEKSWSHFHEIRLTAVKELWNDYTKTIGLPDCDPILVQFASTKLFEMELKKCFQPAVSIPPPPPPSPPSSASLSKEDENAMQYACGFVPYKLLLKYEEQPDDVSVRFSDCLRSMAVMGRGDTIFDYTKEWLKKINRGGLFPLNDLSYCFFIAVESIVRSEIVRSVLPCTLTEPINEKVIHNKDVLHQWSLISDGYLEDEQESIKLLTEIVRLWVTIRGNSLAASWIEQYKFTQKKNIKYSRALRKTLKRKRQDTEEVARQNENVLDLEDCYDDELDEEEI